MFVIKNLLVDLRKTYFIQGFEDINALTIYFIFCVPRL